MAIDIEQLKHAAEAEAKAQMDVIMAESLLKALKTHVNVHMTLEDFAKLLSSAPVKPHLTEWTLSDILSAGSAAAKSSSPRRRLTGDAKQAEIDKVKDGIVAALQGGTEMPPEVMTASIPVSVPSDMVKRRWAEAIKQLRDEEIIERHGERRNTTYTLKK